MKIAIVAGVFPALSETFVLNQVTGLLDRGHDVHVFADRASDDDVTHPDVDAYGLRERTHYWPKGFRALGKAARNPASLMKAVASKNADPALTGSFGSFDAILCHFGHVGERVRKLRESGAISGPLAVIFHAYDVTVLLNERGDDYYEALFAQAELLLPISEYWQKKLIRLGADPDRLAVHHMGIDTERFDRRLRERKAGEPTRFIMIARLVEKKGVEYTVRAMMAARREGAIDAHLSIVGDGPMRVELESIVSDEGAEDSVTFHGWKTHDEVASLLQESHVLVAPSVTAENGDKEGIPVGIMEAMATGMPVISTYHSGIPELVVDGESGLLVPERDVEALAAAVAHMAGDSSDWAAYGRAGRAMVESEFDIDALNDRLVERLAALTTGPRR